MCGLALFSTLQLASGSIRTNQRGANPYAYAQSLLSCFTGLRQ
jgi:hypothetical protein